MQSGNIATVPADGCERSASVANAQQQQRKSVGRRWMALQGLPPNKQEQVCLSSHSQSVAVRHVVNIGSVRSVVIEWLKRRSAADVVAVAIRWWCSRCSVWPCFGCAGMSVGYGAVESTSGAIADDTPGATHKTSSTTCFCSCSSCGCCRSSVTSEYCTSCCCCCRCFYNHHHHGEKNGITDNGAGCRCRSTPQPARYGRHAQSFTSTLLAPTEGLFFSQIRLK